MFTARIFKTGEIVEAQEVLEGKYSRDENFVDVEENLKLYLLAKQRTTEDHTSGFIIL